MATNYQESGKGFDAKLDNRILEERRGKEDEADKGSGERAGEFRAAKRERSESPNSEQAADEAAEQSSDFNSAIVTAKRQKALAGATEKQSEPEDAVATPIRKVTSELLRSSWTNLVPSWGLTLIWINIHIFLGMVLGNKYFCKLGVEWSDKVSGAIAKSGEIKKKLDEKAGNSIGLVEKIGVGCADLGCLLLLGFIIAIIALLLRIVESPMSFFADMVGYVWDADVNAVTKINSSE